MSWSSYLQHSQIYPGNAGLPSRALEEVDVREPDADVALKPVLEDLEQLVDAHSDRSLDLRLLVLITSALPPHSEQ